MNNIKNIEAIYFDGEDISLNELELSDTYSNSDASYDSSSSSNDASSSNNDSNTILTNSSDSSNISDSESEYSISDSSINNLDVKINDLFSSKYNGNEFYGEVLRNQYLIIKKIGYGAFSSVWMGYDVKNKKLVAIKIINPEDIKEGLREIKIYKKFKNIDNTYLLTIIDYFKIKAIHKKYYSDDYKYDNLYHIIIILPLMACTAYDLLETQNYNNGLPYILCFKIIEQTLLAIKTLEENNLMHTDLKPENILICGLNRESDILIKLIKDIDIDKFLSNIIDKAKLDKPDINSEELSSITHDYYKKVTSFIINFIKNEMKKIKKLMKTCIISSNYLNDIKIKLCDFNLVIDIDKNLNKIVQIQTRYYRAPEIILGTGLNKKSDYWSIPCILFELLTSNILFEPKKNKSMNKDLHHIYIIKQLIHDIPKSMLDKSKFYNRIFSNTDNIDINKMNINNIFLYNYNNLNLNKSIIDDICTYIYKILYVEPSKRPSIDDMLYLTREFINKYSI